MSDGRKTKKSREYKYGTVKAHGQTGATKISQRHTALSQCLMLLPKCLHSAR